MKRNGKVFDYRIWFPCLYLARVTKSNFMFGSERMVKTQSTHEIFCSLDSFNCSNNTKKNRLILTIRYLTILIEYNRCIICSLPYFLKKKLRSLNTAKLINL